MAASGGKPPPGGGAPGGAGGTGAKGEAGEKKLIIPGGDDSWKAEAQREKERIQQKAREEEEKALPPPSFLAFMSDLGLQAMLALGLAEIKGAGGPRFDLPAARYTIDLLGILEEKTKGNLTAEESRHLKDLLQNLRITYTRLAALAGGKAPPEDARGGGSGIVTPGQ